MKPEDLNERSTSLDCWQAHHYPATDYVRADWDNGTLARIHRKPRLVAGWWIIPGAAIGAGLWALLLL